MSTLVGYGSSSEEEEPVQIKSKTAGSAIKPNGGSDTVNQQAQPPHTNQSIQDGQETQGPMLGPARPDSNDQNVEEFENNMPSEFSQLSERDKLRYLTQPSHPITALPPSPPGSPDPALNAKFKRFSELKPKGVHFNDDLARKSSFQNPNLLPLLMEKVGVVGEAQYRSSLPEDVFSPAMFPASAFKEELLKSQQQIKEQHERQRKELSAAGKRSIEFTSGSKSATTSRDSTPGLSAKRNKV